ncbi:MULTISPECIES: PH domain-containing protein [unclassified Cellulomonas]|uniref:PH domain-containing protein n=1 Tax=unclassified Cellulomonas TaxID=2620175 RepID=UPI000A71A765|nr:MULTISPECIES: PH domain-containing protein [unclassified Cellulomonas]MCR6705836.1 PH domain-containing protein [Cellulomonas sp.]
MGPTLRFSSRYGRWLTVAAGAAGVVAVASIAATDGLAAALRALPVTGLLVLLLWAAYWRPEVEVSDGGITVRNVWRTAVIPWPTYRDAEVRFSLRIETTDGAVEAWAPARSSGSARWLSRRGPAAPALPADDERVDGTAEDTLRAIVDRHAVLARAGHLDRAESAVATGAVHVARAWHARLLGATLVLLAASVLVLAA